MRVRLLPSAIGADVRHQFLISTLFNDNIAIDAGCLGVLPLSQQRPIKHVFLTHSHSDHLATLPLFLDQVHDPGNACVKIYAHPETLAGLREHVFNDVLWPDFVKLIHRGTRFCELIELDSGVPIDVEGIKLTPVALDHVVPNLGFLVDDGQSVVALVSDTGPTTEIWEVAQQAANLKAVLIEASFPDEQAELARVSQHLTPALLLEEYHKLNRPVPFLAMHIKPAFYDTIVTQLRALAMPGLIVAQPGIDYEF